MMLVSLEENIYNFNPKYIIFHLNHIKLDFIQDSYVTSMTYWALYVKLIYPCEHSTPNTLEHTILSCGW